MKAKLRLLGVLTILTTLAIALTMSSALVKAQEGTAPVTPTNGKEQLVAADADVVNMNEPAIYIIQLADAPLASYRGGVQGLAATNPAAAGTTRLTNTAATAAYLDYLSGVQATFLSNVNQSLGRNVDVKFTYRHAFNGVAISVTPLEAQKLAQMDGVAMVTRETIEEVSTDAGPEWIGATDVWSGTGLPAGLNTQGEDVVVAILDTGVNSTHPSFAAVGGDGYVHTNPLTYYLGVCDPNNPDYQPSFVCNDKLIGVHDFIDGDGNDPDSPEDGDGHGSHTGSTVAGNVVTATLFAPTAAITQTISGVAPHANIIAYDVCRNGTAAEGGGCPGSSTLAAINQVVADSMVLPNGVAAINYSISGGENPYGDPGELAFLAATDAGVFVSASAGNAGPGAGTVAHVSPWVATIAASTHNRNLTNNVVSLTSDGPTLADIDGVGFTAGYGPAPILYAGNFGDALCLNPFAPGTFSGQIVICDRGTNARVDKGANVLAGGAGGMILADNGAGVVSDAHFLPATHITQADGVALKAWVAANTNPMGEIAGTAVDLSPANGDIMAGFSSRGPVGAFGVLKPDVTAPGVSIWAAVNNDGSGPDDYGFLSGTSMSSPHNAGAAALMAALYPTWTPHQIKSALMLTADNVDNYKEDGVTPTDPFDLGAGRIQVNAAANTGFVLNETTANFEAADPGLNNGQETLLQQLNVASLANANCVGGCSWTRTIESVISVSADYTVTATAPAGINITVTPATFTLAAGGTQELTIEADVSGATITGDWAFASIQFETDATVPALQTPVAPAATSVFTATPALAIPDNGYNGTLASMACSTIDASAIPAGDVVTDVWVEVAAAHTWVGDVTIKLQSPDASILGVLSRPGAADVGDDGTDAPFGDSSNFVIASPLTYGDVFTDSAETMGNTIADAGNICANDGRCDYAPAPGSVVGVPNFAGFANENASGNWQLCIGDSAAGDTGTFQQWVLTVDHVASGGGSVAVSDASMPIALIAAAGNIPSRIDVETRRDADSYTLNDLEAVAITDSQVTMYGPAQADLHVTQLLLDPSNGAPYDDLSQVYWTTVEVPAGAKRLVAEILASTSLDLDLFWGTGNTPSAATEVGNSATGAVLEYLSANDPAPGTYWVLVQNWQASGAGVADDVALAVGVVPDTDSGLATFDMPASVPAGDPFSATLYWDFPGSVLWDQFYGVMELGADAGNPTNLGTVDIDITRVADDVTKEASTATAEPGDTVTYTITVGSNPTPETLAYVLTDTIPTGMTYISGTLSASSGTANVNGNTITWSGDLTTALGYVYGITDNVADPSCDTPFGGYVDLAAFSLFTDPGINGDDISWTYSGRTTDFYNVLDQIPVYTSNGYVTFGSDFSVDNQNLPDPTVPNNIIASLWRDFVVVYNAGLNQGVTSATAGSGSIQVLEYDDIQVFGDAAQTLDMNIITLRDADPAPGNVDIAFAYDNVNLSTITGTIGVENATGTLGTLYAYDDVAVTNGLIVCLDLFNQLADPVTITYQAMVDAGVADGTVLTNVVEHDNDGLGTAVETSEASVTVALPATYGVELDAPTAAITGTIGTTVTYSINITNTGSTTDTFDIAVTGNGWTTTAPADITLGAGEMGSIDVTVAISGTAAAGDQDMATVAATSQMDVMATASVELTTTAEEMPATGYGIYLPLILKP